MATILLELWPECSKELIMAALYHDVPESLIGDNPTPIKWKFPDLAKELEKVEKEVMKDMAIYITLERYEKVMLKIADMMELLWFCVEEERRGNRNFKEVFVRGTKYLQDIFIKDNKVDIANPVDMLNKLIAMEADL